MPDPKETNGAAEEAPRTLRDIAEASYDEVIDASEESEASEEPGQEGRQRDSLGRFVKQESGEAEAEEPPSPDQESQVPVAEQAHPAPVTGEAAQPPSNWSAEDRANFAKLEDQWAREFLLRRHSEMEGDYQKRVQATAISNQFVQAVTPVFNDPDIAESLRQEGRSPIEAVYQWAGFHKRALSPDLSERVTLLFDLAQRMQIDPAAVFGLSATPAGLSKEDMANPAVKKLADQITQLSTRIQSQETDYQRRLQAEQNVAVGAKRVEVDAFADQKNADGTLAHPYFDHFLPVIMEYYRANPEWTIAQCYDKAVAPVRDGLAAQLKAQMGQQQNMQRAQSAVRSNVRGMTAPVSRPDSNGAKRGLRQVLEDSADEVGY